jgi:hypothetical protein
VRPALLALGAALSSCAQFVQYTDELVDPKTGRPFVVTVPAAAGGFCGFLIGIPATVIALPVTFTVYQVQRDQNEVTADPISTMLFPSFVLWRTGTLVALPLDMLHYMVARAGRPAPTPSREEQTEAEYQIDQQTLPRYPVTPIYPVEE